MHNIISDLGRRHKPGSQFYIMPSQAHIGFLPAVIPCGQRQILVKPGECINTVRADFVVGRRSLNLALTTLFTFCAKNRVQLQGLQHHL